MDADGADEDEPRRDAPDQRAERVEGVQQRQLAPEPPDPVDERARDYGQRGAHQDRGREDHDRREQPAHADEREGVRRQPRRRPGVNGLEPPHDERPGERRCADPQLEERIQPERRAAPVGQSTEQPAAERQAAEERGQDGGDGVRSHAEHLLEQPGPDDLVDEPRGAREEEERRRESEEASWTCAHLPQNPPSGAPIRPQDCRRYHIRVRQKRARRCARSGGARPGRRDGPPSSAESASRWASR